MAVKIRLRRVGRKKSPMYRIVVADSKSQYQPRTGDQALNLDADRVHYWLNVGAQPTDTVRSLLRKAGVLKQRHESRLAAKLQASAVPMKNTDEA
jgi:small subunit ribosomal protein S16